MISEKPIYFKIDTLVIQNPYYTDNFDDYNDKYTHNPITKTYGKYTLINMDFYGIAIDREVSIMIINNDKIIMLDWNENHSR